MATTSIPFTPSIASPFRFTFQADGATWAAVVTWNVFGQRWYLNVYFQDGTRVFTVPLVGSSTWVTTPLATQEENYLARVFNPYLVGVGALVLSQNVETATRIAAIDSTVVALSAPSLSTGTDNAAQFSNDINLAAGYFTSSTLVYRANAGRFEISDTIPTPPIAPPFVSPFPPSPFPPSSSPAAIPPSQFILDHSLLGGPDVLV